MKIKVETLVGDAFKAAFNRLMGLPVTNLEDSMRLIALKQWITEQRDSHIEKCNALAARLGKREVGGFSIPQENRLEYEEAVLELNGVVLERVFAPITLSTQDVPPRWFCHNDLFLLQDIITLVAPPQPPVVAVDAARP